MNRWQTVALADTVTCLDSQRIPVKDDDRRMRLGSVPYYGANGQVGWIDRPLFNEPLLLIAEDGGHFDEPNKGVAYTIHGPAWVNNHAHVLRPDARRVMLDFLGYYFRHFDFLPYITGTTRAKLTQRDLMRVEVPVPPLAEQERIVKLLDEADELRKLRERADHRTADLIPALFHEMFGDPTANSRRWPLKPLGELASNQDGRRKPVKASDRAARQGEYPYYGASGIIDYVGEYLFDGKALLVGEDGANLLARSTPIAFLAHGKYWVNNHAHVLTENGKADLSYLCAILNLRDLTDYVTGSAQPKLSQANMNRISIPVPPLPLQNEFARRVTEIRELKSRQTTSRQRLDKLFQSMLHRAFNGEV
jgi:type I restriction enzyme, S subunit